MGNKYSCIDCCFGPIRASERFDPSKGNKVKMDSQDVLTMITSNGLGILVLVVAEFILSCMWMSLSFVQGFALYDGTTGHAHPISHFGWWIILEWSVIFAGAFTWKFLLSASNLSSSAKFEYSITDARNYLVFYIVMLFLGIVSNIVHFSLTLVENSFCSSSFCRGFNVIDPANAALLGQPPSTSVFLILFLVLLSALILFQIFLVFRAFGYRTHLGYAVWRDKTLFEVKVDFDDNTDTFSKTAPPEPNNAQISSGSSFLSSINKVHSRKDK